MAIFKVTMPRAECGENLLSVFGRYNARYKISWTAYKKKVFLSSGHALHFANVT